MPGIIQDVNDFEKTSTVLYFNGQKKEILNSKMSKIDTNKYDLIVQNIIEKLNFR